MSAGTTMRCAATVTLLLGLVLGRAIDAQSVRGVVVDQAGRPIRGVLTELVDETARPVARTLTNERGEYRLLAPRAGTYRLHTLRIGFRPVTGDAFILDVGQERTEQVALRGVALALDTVRVVDRSACRLAGDSATATFAIWEQIHAAFTAAQLTARGAGISATTVGYQRLLDATTHRVLDQTTSIRSGLVTQPWVSLAPEELRRVGYVRSDNGDTNTFYAPGLDALLSEAFAEDHCLRVANSPNPARVGIEFTPAKLQRRIADIRGTVWVDKRTAELRAVEFRYVNVSEVTDAGRVIEREAGGDMDFVRLPNGAWVISHWVIRMPMFASRPARQSTSASKLSAIQGDEPAIAAIKEAGGQLSLVTEGTDTLYESARVALAGSVVDSLSGAAVAKAQVSVVATLLDIETDSLGRFRITGMLPGEYTLEVRTPSLDSASAVQHSSVVITDAGATVRVRVPTASQLVARICRATGASLEQPGVVFGVARIRADSNPPRDLRVLAEWTDASRQPRWLDARTNAGGAFRLCGVPVNTTISLRAESDSALAGSIGSGAGQRTICPRRSDARPVRGAWRNAHGNGDRLGATGADRKR